MPQKRIIPKNALEQLYLREGLSLHAIAKRLHTSTHTLYRNLKEYKVPLRKRGELHKTHGMSNTRQYHIWQQIKTRCDNKNDHNYQKYGAKGISYPDKWETFEGFWEDMSEGYDDSKTIDRIDSSGNYSKDNCHWTDYSGQNRNKSDNVLLTLDGKTQCIAAWAEEVDIPQSTLYTRKRNGWDDEKILTLPPQARNQYSSP
jgi:predicted DNA-binding protein YlxM (UPF0122 family)